MTKKKFELITNVMSIFFAFIVFTLMCYGNVYLRKTGDDLPWLWAVLIAITIALIVFLVCFQKIGEKYFNIPKAESRTPTWKDFLRNFVVIMSMNLMHRKTRNIAHRARYNLIDKNSAISDIIKYHCVAFVLLMSFVFIGEYFNNRKKLTETDTEQQQGDLL